MTLDDLVREVIEETKRPDLQSRIISQIRSSTQAVHLAERWSRDIAEETINFAIPAIKGTINTADLIRFRRVDAMWPMIDGVPVDDGLIKVDNFTRRDAAGVLIDDYWYIIGTTITVGCSYPIQELKLSYLQNPDCMVSNYSSWIADEYPFLIIYHAAATLLERIGAKDMAAKCKAQASEEFKLMQSNLI